MNPSQPCISIRQLSKFYGTHTPVHALRGVDLDIFKGEMIAIMGPSGSGKSTLLNTIGLLDDASSGSYLLNGQPVHRLSEKKKAHLRNSTFGFVLQDFALIEQLSTEHNVAVPLSYTLRRLSSSEKRVRISSMLESLGIADKQKELVCNLSGGQRQRVAIARALINQPEIILADEPTGALDSETAADIMQILKALHTQGKTVLIITHDATVASYCTKVLFIKDGMLNNSL